MKNFYSVVLSVLLIMNAPCAEGQLWKHYADSAKYYSEKQLFDKAIVLYQKALEELKKDSVSTLTYANICNDLAEIYGEKDEYGKAEPLFLQVREIIASRRDKNNFEYATSCHNLGRLYMAMAKYRKAEFFYLEDKAILEKIRSKEDRDYATTCNNLANVYSNLGEFGKAESLHLEIKQIRERLVGKGNADYAVSCNNLGALYVTMGQFDKAEPLYLEAKRIRDSLRSKDKSRRIHSEYANTCNNLAILYWHIGEYQKSETLHIEAKNVREKIFTKENSSYAQSCSNLGNLYTYTGQFQKAESLLLESREIRERVVGKLDYEYAQTCHNLGVFYADRRQYKKAEQLYLEVKNIREKVHGKEHPHYANTCHNLGALYRLMGQYAKAEQFYLEARQIRVKLLGVEHPDYQSTCQGLANLYWNWKIPEKAIEFYREAFTVQNIAQRKVFKFTSEAEKQSYLKKFSGDQDYFFSFATSLYPHSRQGLSYDISLSQRHLILSSSRQLLEDVYASADTSIKKRYSSWVVIKQQLAFWHAKSDSNRAQTINELESKANDLEKELNRLSASFERQNKDNFATWKDIQQRLETDEAAIEFVKFNYYDEVQRTDSIYYVALLIRKDIDQPQLIPLFESRQLEKLLGNAYTLNTITTFYTFNKKSNSVFNLSWHPLEKHLSGIKRIYYAPAGILHRVSFAALVVNDRQVLSDKYQLVQLNTTASVINQAELIITTGDTIRIYGGIKYDVDSSALKQAVLAYSSSDDDSRFFPAEGTRGNGWTYLPSTEKEINQIAALGKQKNFPVALYSGIIASEESLKSLNAKLSPSVLHIATHGFFFPDPKKNIKATNEEPASGKAFKLSDNPLFRSGLLFAGANHTWTGKQIGGVEDGILTAYEVSNLYLPNTKLVVLSACETGLGDILDNEGVYGLQRAFKMASVENLVMSLWKVPDKTTVEFMQEFYKGIFDKLSISESFRNAQTIMKNLYRKEPYKWAAWILVK